MAYPVYKDTYIETAATTLVKTGAGNLKGILIGETAAGAITVYDGLTAAGTVKMVLKASVAEGYYPMPLHFSTGLTIVTAGASKILVSYE